METQWFIACMEPAMRNAAPTKFPRTAADWLNQRRPIVVGVPYMRPSEVKNTGWADKI